ncbi:hypothetical protein ACFFX0_07495 [Citricoccus parietis]|uniref:Uncharacterized protein n=1 Tax=Citricoccus parietis TaxID=592307 RepID=A0ABV5FWH1_9MICC
MPRWFQQDPVLLHSHYRIDATVSAPGGTVEVCVPRTKSFPPSAGFPWLGRTWTGVARNGPVRDGWNRSGRSRKPACCG